jgi:RNA polymerase sigma-70 factor, ECF subfamily
MEATREGERRVSIQQGWFAIGDGEGRSGMEAALLRAGQAGDRTALEQLLALHERPLLSLCRGILAHAEDAEDAAQETFLRALRALPRFRPGRATFRTWLFRIAVNVCLNWKRDRRRTAPWDDENPGLGDEANSPESIAIRRLEVLEALRELPPRHRAIFLLKVQEGWSVAEIGVAMGWSPIRVQNELSKARRALAAWQAQRAHEGV